jgi:hypothetical protein
MRPYARDPQAYDAFVKQWIFEVKMPEYRYLEKPLKQKNGNVWEVTAVIKNVGNATMPVDVAGVTGDRYQNRNSIGNPERRFFCIQMSSRKF